MIRDSENQHRKGLTMGKTVTATVRSDGQLHFTHEDWAMLGIDDPRGHGLIARLDGTEMPLRIVQHGATRHGVDVLVAGDGWKAAVRVGAMEIVGVQRP
jgi:hypothetical protein